MRCTMVLALILACWAVAVHAQETTDSPTNEFCPVLTDQHVDPNIYVEYQGKRVYFCCQYCRKSFLENPEKYVDNLPQFASDKQATSPDHDEQHSQPHTEQNGAAAHEEHGSSAMHEHHETSGEQVQGIRRFVHFLGEFHPVVVHFPIALLITAFFAEGLFMFYGKPMFRETGLFCIWLGALSAIVAASLGWAAAMGTHFPPPLADALEDHRWFGMSAGITAIIAALFALKVRKSASGRGWTWLYRLALITGAVLVGITGHLGAILVYGFEHFHY